MLKLFLLTGWLVSLVGCKQRNAAADSEITYAAGSWWNDSSGNFLISIAERQEMSFCMDAAGQPDSARFAKDSQTFSTHVRFALLEWFRAIDANVSIQQAAPHCKANPSNGLLRVVLHYNEQAFQREISQSSASTLGVYNIGEGSLFLNMAGVMNPRRDPTLGKKTILHELGHAFGLHHSVSKGAVMQANLSVASERLTPDDVIGIESVWKRIRGSKPPLQGDSPSPTVRPVSGRQWMGGTQSTDAPVKLSLRHDTWFKTSTDQSFRISEGEKCPLQQGQKLDVEVLNAGRTEAGHLKVRLRDELAGCASGKIGSVGYLYQSHID